MKDIVIACCRVAQKNPNLIIDEQSKDWWKWRDTILLHEDVLLEVLCFDLTIDAPHKLLFQMMKFYAVEHNKPLRNAAWAFVTDSNLTQLCLLCSSRTIAAAALYAAARLCDVRLPDSDGRAWWETQRVRLQDMLKAAHYMGANYEHVPGKASGPDGGQSIYVGLRTPVGLLNGEFYDDADDSLPWEQTRLKSEQGIATPAQPTVDLDVARRVSASSQGSKRVRDGGANGQARPDAESDGSRDAKRRRVSSGDGTNGAVKTEAVASVKAEPPVETALPATNDAEDGSEEGEVEE